MLAALALMTGCAMVVLPMSASDAQAKSCQQCRQEYNQCRITRKGSLSCDRQYQRCLRKCLRR